MLFKNTPSQHLIFSFFYFVLQNLNRNSIVLKVMYLNNKIIFNHSHKFTQQPFNPTFFFLSLKLRGQISHNHDVALISP